MKGCRFQYSLTSNTSPKGQGRSMPGLSLRAGTSHNHEILELEVTSLGPTLFKEKKNYNKLKPGPSAPWNSPPCLPFPGAEIPTWTDSSTALRESCLCSARHEEQREERHIPWGGGGGGAAKARRAGLSALGHLQKPEGRTLCLVIQSQVVEPQGGPTLGC